jgi:hypothetical protein
MKKIHILAAALLLILAACNNESKTEEIPSAASTQTFDAGYDFSETTDKHFCDAGAIVGTDCGGGNMLFTKNGNVIYFFFCMGGDTSNYLVGKYKTSNDQISCTFDRSYTFFRGQDSPEDPTAEQKPVDINAGKMETIKPWTITLKKLDCKDFQYSFAEGEYLYVLRQGTDRSKNFAEDVKKIKALADL